MAFAIPKLTAAQIAARSSPSVFAAEASLLPFVIIALSFLLVATSFLRKWLEVAGQKRSPSPTAFAYLFGALLATAEGSEADASTPGDESAETALVANDLEKPLWQEAEDPQDACPQGLPEATTSEAREQVADEPTDLGWGCSQQQIYTKALLLCHRQLAIRIAQGPPGLVTSYGAVATPENAGLVARRPSRDEPNASTAPPPQALSLQELQAMAAPTRWQKLLVCRGHGEPFHIHVNASQNRYQVYRDRVELKSLSWGGKTMPRLQDAWRQACNIVAKSEKA